MMYNSQVNLDINKIIKKYQDLVAELQLKVIALELTSEQLQTDLTNAMTLSNPKPSDE